MIVPEQMGFDFIGKLADIGILASTAGITWLVHAVSQIRRQLVLQNGRIGKMEQWKDDHDERDDDRIGDLRDRLEAHVRTSHRSTPV